MQELKDIYVKISLKVDHKLVEGFS